MRERLAIATLTLAAALATAVAYAVYSRLELRWVVLGWVGLVPWLAALDRVRSLRGAIASGVVMSVAFTLAVFGWFALGIGDYTALSVPAAMLVFAALAPLVQPQFIVFAAARHVTRRRSGVAAAAIVGACAYVGAEWAVPKLFGDTLGHCLYPSVWMRQAADVAGAPGLTLVLLLANACALAAARALWSGRATLRAAIAAAAQPAAGVALLAGALCAYGAVRVRQLDTATPATAPLTAGIVQANLSHYDRMRAERGTYDTVRLIVDTYVDMSRALLGRAPLDLLIWPETMYPTTFGVPKSAEGAAFDREIVDFVTRANVPLVFGSYDVGDGAEYNAAMFLEPQADAGAAASGAAAADGALGAGGTSGTRGAPRVQTYRKAWPFPLTEYVPPVLDTPTLRRWLPWLGTWKPGAGAKVVAVDLRDGRTLRIAPLICYDVLDPGLVLAAARAGADVIVTLSNDSWFARGAGPRLHLLGAEFRSIETRLPQLRATNTGISAVITPSGDVVERAGVDERATLVARIVPGQRSRTLAVAWGDWLGPVALAVALVSLATSALTRQRRTNTGAMQARNSTSSKR